MVIWLIAAFLAGAMTVTLYRQRAKMTNPLPYVLTGFGTLMFLVAAVAS